MPPKARKTKAGAPPPPADGKDGVPAEPEKSPKIRRKVAKKIPAPAALAALKTIAADFQTLREHKEAAVLRAPIRHDSEGVVSPAKNRALFAYEDALLKLLERLDAVEHENIGAIREARKNHIKNIQARLKVLDAVKRGEHVEIPAPVTPAKSSPSRAAHALKTKATAAVDGGLAQASSTTTSKWALWAIAGAIGAVGAYFAYQASLTGAE
ncbi:hypothetical protein HKX48_004029 [Thoreauomyces humboldtii]|nr:hypothetical protein HKX48_004029 [Thoreauomyces humboldtii]